MKLGLGTVQFGMDYGISNSDGRTSLNEVKVILQFAQERGIDVIDTAYSYGDSESVLGSVLSGQHPFRIITKTPVYQTEKISSADAEHLKTSFNSSLKRLRQSKLAGLLIHNADNLLTDGGEVLFNAMEELKQAGVVDKIGVSVYSGEQIDLIIKKYAFDLIQVPVNVLDQRLIHNGQLKMLKSKGIEIHARSVFLQGLLLMEPASLQSFFAPLKPLLYKYREFLSLHGLTPIEGAIGFIKKVYEINCLIIGVNNLKQFKLNINSFKKKYKASLFDSFKRFSTDNLIYLNPASWKYDDKDYYEV